MQYPGRIKDTYLKKKKSNIGFRSKTYSKERERQNSSKHEVDK